MPTVARITTVLAAVVAVSATPAVAYADSLPPAPPEKTGPVVVEADSPEGERLLDRIDAAALRTGKKARQGWVSESTTTDTYRVGGVPRPEDQPWLAVQTRVEAHRPHSVEGAAKVTRTVMSEGVVQDEWPYANGTWGAVNMDDGVTAWTTPPVATALDRQAWAAAQAANANVSGVHFTPKRAGGWDITDRPNTPEAISHWADTNGLTPWGVVMAATLRDDLAATRITHDGDVVTIEYVGADWYTHSGSLRVTFDGRFVARAVFTVTFPSPWDETEFSTAVNDARVLQLGPTEVPAVTVLEDEAWAEFAVQQAGNYSRNLIRQLVADDSVARLPVAPEVPMTGAGARVTVAPDGKTATVRVGYVSESASAACEMTVTARTVSRCVPAA